MALVELGATVPDLEVAHLALYASRVEAAAAAHAPAAGDVGEQRGAPGHQALRGEGPRLAASYV